MSDTGEILTPDLAIIGAGSGNMIITRAWRDASVVIAESSHFGGTCLNVGCIPTKMFVRASDSGRAPREAERLGVDLEFHGANWPQIRDRIFGRIDHNALGAKEHRENQSHVRVLSEHSQLTGPRSFITASGIRVEPKQLVLAAGARPTLPPFPGVTLPGVYTSDTIMRIDALPKRLVIVGGGFIACEFAAIFAGLGSHVTLLVRGDGLMKFMDDEIATAFTAQARSNWEVQLNTNVTGISQDGEDLLTVTTDSAVHTADAVLLATGRTPNSDLLGAADVGYNLHDDGRLVVDEYLRPLHNGEPLTGVYALGDLCSPTQLKHVANEQARVVGHNLLNPNSLRADSLSPRPAAVFTDPELAQAGLTEREAVEQYGAEALNVHVQRYSDTAYGWAMEDSVGLMKIIVQRSTGLILGVHAMGYQASNLIQPVVMAMSFGIDAHTAARGQYWIHPALMEVTENAFLGAGVKPSVAGTSMDR